MDVHQEADMIANSIYNRFGTDILQLKDPTMAQIEATFKAIDGRIERGFDELKKKKIFCFAYVGHGIEINKSLNILLHGKEDSKQKF